MVRRYVPPSTSSTPATARAAKNASNPAPSNGGRKGSRSTSAPADTGSACRPASLRSVVGGTPYTSRTVSLNCRTLANPDANAMSAIPIGVVSTSSRAVCARWARARASGPAPSSADSTRPRWRSEYPRRVASPGTPSRSTTPSPISRIARPARSARTFQSGEPGTASGRQRRQARKPRSWAAAAVGQNSTLVAFGVIAGQEGRQ